MTTKTDDLKPCPCCGGEAAFNTTRTTCPETIKLNKRDTGYGVNCVVCGINNRGLVLGYESKALAAEAWNRRTALQSQDREDALRYRFIRSIVSASNARGRGSWQFHYDRLPMPLNNPMKGSVAQHFDEAIDHARRAEGDGE